VRRTSNWPAQVGKRNPRRPLALRAERIMALGGKFRSRGKKLTQPRARLMNQLAGNTPCAHSRNCSRTARNLRDNGARTVPVRSGRECRTDVGIHAASSGQGLPLRTGTGSGSVSVAASPPQAAYPVRALASRRARTGLAAATPAAPQPCRTRPCARSPSSKR